MRANYSGGIRVGNYNLTNELGRGTFGVTYLADDLIRRKKVAVKTIDIEKSRKLGVSALTIKEEIETLRNLTGTKCPDYLACYYESFEGSFQGIQTIFIVSEYIEGGSLTEFVRNNGGKLQVSFLWPLMLQLILGLKYIHKNNYAHRDIKPDNILITQDYTIKYIDFGLACLARCRESDCTNTCKGRGGTLLYMPPEFFNGTQENSLRASKAHDVWSLTMVFFELINGLYRFPYSLQDQQGRRLNQQEIKRNITMAPQFSSAYSLDDGRTNNFIDNITVNDWRRRPTIIEIKRFFVHTVLAKVY